MKKSLLLLFLIFSCYAEVQDSIVPLANRLSLKDFDRRISQSQKRSVQRKLKCDPHVIRIMSFNMLFNIPEKEAVLAEKHHWKNRYYRIVEYLDVARPDIFGTQELFFDQIENLMEHLQDEYKYYGIGRKDRDRKGSLETIFYRKDRFTLLESKTHAISEEENVFGVFNALTFCKFLDRLSKKTFIVLNTHLEYRDVNLRAKEVKNIKSIVEKIDKKTPILLLGDFNTFPMRYDLDLPFYDGPFVEKTITSAGLLSSMQIALLGHVGPISSTTYCNEKRDAFCCPGTPGVILDHIFVNPCVNVVLHAIDPARVDGEFPSDHLPVFADVLLK